MKANQKQLEKLLRQFQSGDSDALVEMVELERASLFDYLFRMCGQRDAVVRILDEFVMALKSDNQLQFGSLNDFYISIYATSRSFCSHMWNADTSELVNEGYQDIDTKKLEPNPSVALIERIERSIAKFPGWEREPLLLYVRAGLGFESIAIIMSSSQKAVEDGYYSALLKLTPTANSTNPQYLRGLVELMPVFKLAGISSHGTVALSQLMGDIDKAKTPFMTPRNLVLLILVTIAAGAAIVRFL